MYIKFNHKLELEKFELRLNFEPALNWNLFVVVQ